MTTTDVKNDKAITLDAQPASNGADKSNKHARQPNGSPKSPYKQRRGGQSSSPPPNSTLVLKNLDFNLEQADLEEVLRGLCGGRLGYKNFYLQKDPNGQFRGMAFVNFHTVEEAQKAISALRHVVLNGRKIYPEYRRLSRQEIARREYEAKRGIRGNNNGHQNKRFDIKPRTTFESTINDSEKVLDENGKELDKRALFFKRYTEERGESKFSMNGKHGFKGNLRSAENTEFESKYRELLTAYRDEENVEGQDIPDFKFEEHLDSQKRLLIHQLCDQLGLAHISRNFEESGGDAESGKLSSKEESSSDDSATKDESSKSLPATVPKVKSRRMIIVSRDPAKRAVFKQESIQQRKAAKELAIKKRKEMAEKPKQAKVPLTEEEHKSVKWFKPRAQQLSEGKEHAANEIQKPSYKVYIPSRQPKGPDGTTGFHSRKARHPSSDGLDDKGMEVEVNGSSESSDGKESNSGGDADGSGKSEAESIGSDNGEAPVKKKKSKKLNPLVRPFIPASMTK